MELKHSGMGTASFVISIIGSVSMFVLFALAGAMETSKPGGMNERSTQAVVLGLLVISVLFVNLVAVGLGVAGLFQKERKKVFAILGTIFSGITVILTVALLIIGLTVKSP